MNLFENSRKKKLTEEIRKLEAEKALLAKENQELKATVDSIEQSRNNYLNFFQKNISGVYRTSLDGQLLDCNDAFIKMLAYENIDELKGIVNTKLYQNKELRLQLIQKLETEQTLVNVEIDLIQKDGSIIHCIENLVGIFDEDSQLHQIQGYLLNRTEERKTLNKLSESEQRYRQMFESNQAIKLIIDPESGKIIEANNAALKFYGYSKKLITSMFISEINQASDEEIQEEMARAKEENRNHFYFKHKTSTNEIRNVEVYSGPIYLNNQPLLYSIIHDISNRSQIEQALQESDERYEELVKMLPEAVFETDSHLNITFVNERTLEMTNYTTDDVKLGLNGINLIAPEDRTKALRFFSDRSNGIDKGPTEYQAVKKDGTPFRIVINASSIFKDDVFCGLRGIIIDVTERKLNEAKRIESEEKYRSLYTSANDAIFLMQDGIFKSCNPKTLEIYQCKKSEILEHSPAEFSPEFQPCGNLSSELSKEKISLAINGEPQFFEWVHLHKNGTPFNAEVSLNRLVLRNGVYVQAIVREITTRKKNEEKIKRFSTILEDSLNEIYLFEPDTLFFKQANHAAQINLGYTNDELLKMCALDIKPLFTPTSFNELIMPLINGSKNKIVFETLHRRKDQTEYEVEVHLQYFKYQHESLFAAIALDISERKSAEKNLKEHQSHLEELVKERTSKIENQYKELQRYNGIFEGREFRIKELRDKVKELEDRLKKN